MQPEMRKLMITLILTVLVAIGGVLIGRYAWNTTYLKRYEVTVVVQAVEKSERFGEHTNLIALTYAGEEAKTYKFVGHRDFQVGGTYTIRFRNERGGLLRLEVWGRIESMERIG